MFVSRELRSDLGRTTYHLHATSDFLQSRSWRMSLSLDMLLACVAFVGGRFVLPIARELALCILVGLVFLPALSIRLCAAEPRTDPLTDSHFVA